MDDTLQAIVQAKLSAEGVAQKNWASLVLAACDGLDSLERLLRADKTVQQRAPPSVHPPIVGAYLSSLTVQGFRGIGPKATLSLNPGPGLTLVVGRNGSGKSSFAEALEVLFTGESKRWAGRSKIWKDGWRNLHLGHPAEIQAGLVLEGQGPLKVTAEWAEDAALEDATVVVQPKSKPKTSLEAMGWSRALASHRPFLSYNELGSMLDEGPSKLYDALSLVLGLEDLVDAQNALAKSRLTRQQAFDSADQEREAFVEQLRSLLQRAADERGRACLDALTSKSWGLNAVTDLVDAGRPASAAHEISILNKAVAMEGPDPARVLASVSALRDAAGKAKLVAGTDGERALHLATLLEGALAFHGARGDCDCPVCGTKKALDPRWRKASLREVERLRKEAAVCAEAHRAVDNARKSARELLTAPPRLLEQLFEIGLDGLDVVRERWASWRDGASLTEPAALATHLESQSGPLSEAIDHLREAAAAELRRREDLWQPIASTLSGWITRARAAQADAEWIPLIKAAEKWLKDASAEIRNERFAPIADLAMATWQHLRLHSNVELGRIELTGVKSQRRVTLDVTVDGVPGAALGVMSQGELHSLALSLFLPRATLPDSPFRFVVIDDPVQSMDPSRVDGLARALEQVAATRQVIVFTHDERLSEAVRRLAINAIILGLTRRPKSIVEIKTALDPIRAHIEDALALAQTTELPMDVLQKLVPGFCRSALEAACTQAFRRRRLAVGESHESMEHELELAGKLTPLAALALFDDRARGADVMKRLNQIGGWAGDVFKQCKDGVHEVQTADIRLMISDAEKLAKKIAELQ